MSPERNWHRFTSRRLEQAIILHLMTRFADSFIHQRHPRTVNAVALTKGMVGAFACPFRIRHELTSASLYNFNEGGRTDVSMCRPIIFWCYMNI
jgi:hypothetical protein